MSREDIAFYANVASGLGGPPGLFLLFYTIYQDRKKQNNRFGSSMSDTAAAQAAPYKDNAFSTRVYVMAVFLLFLYCLGAFGAIFSKGKQGLQGVPGLRGAEGPVGPRGEAGLNGKDANTSSIEARLMEIKQKAETAYQEAAMLRRYIKVKDCVQGVADLKPALKAAFDREVQLITPPSGAQGMALVYARRGYYMQQNLLAVVSQDYAYVKKCMPGFSPVLVEPSEEQLETPVPNEPKGDFDQQRKYRRAYSKNLQADQLLDYTEAQLKTEEQNLKTKLDD